MKEKQSGQQQGFTAQLNRYLRRLTGQKAVTHQKQQRLTPPVTADRKAPVVKSPESSTNNKVLDPNVKAITFTMSLIALAAQLAKIDGILNNKETSSFKEIFPLHLNHIEESTKLFNEAHNDTTPPELHAKRIARMFADSPAIRMEVMESLLKFAAVDDLPNTKEMHYLHEIGEILGMSRETIRHMLRKQFIPMETDPYKLLGISKKATDLELKKMYRLMVSDCHPDKLSGGNIAKEIIPIASERFNILKEAYEKIEKRRRLPWRR